MDIKLHISNQEELNKVLNKKIVKIAHNKTSLIVMQFEDGSTLGIYAHGYDGTGELVCSSE